MNRASASILACAVVALAACPRQTVAPIDVQHAAMDAAVSDVCPLADVSHFVAQPWVAPNPQSAACTDADIDAYYSACLDPSAIPALCEQFNANHPTCAQCLLPRGDAGAGPLRVTPGQVSLNVGGCIAIALADDRPTGCGAREQTARDCVNAACIGCSGSTECIARAKQQSCGTYALQTCPELAVGAWCALDATFASQFHRIAHAFCVGGP